MAKKACKTRKMSFNLTEQMFNDIQSNFAKAHCKSASDFVTLAVQEKIERATIVDSINESSDKINVLIKATGSALEKLQKIEKDIKENSSKTDQIHQNINQFSSTILELTA